MIKLLRKRWKRILWIFLMLVIFLNLVGFFGISGSGHFKSSELDNAVSHIQIQRKRLNTSKNSSHTMKEEIIEPQYKSVDNVSENEFDSMKVVDLKADKYKSNDFEPHKSSKDEVFNYSIPEVDEFVRQFQEKYSMTVYGPNHDTPYQQLSAQLYKRRKIGSRLVSYTPNKWYASWKMFHNNIHQHYLYDPGHPSFPKLLEDMVNSPITDVEQKEGGTQIKLLLTFDTEAQALAKPMRFPRDHETLPDHFYFSDYERHNAEIAAFHLDLVLGFHRVPPTVGRMLNISKDIQPFADKKFARTFFTSPAGNLCFHGQCSYYCDSSHPICGHPIMLEVSLAAFLPPLTMAKRKTWRNPWKRSYSKHRKAYWEVYDDLCEKVKLKHPYNEGRRLLDVLDMSVFDFLQGNLDRHHYEIFKAFGNNTFLLHMDNGRAFGKSHYDCMSCLAPVKQCCMIRLSTLAKLVKLYLGPDHLSKVMKISMTSDPLSPILTDAHLDALDRRVSKILAVVNGCLQTGRRWKDVIIDDGVS